MVEDALLHLVRQTQWVQEDEKEVEEEENGRMSGALSEDRRKRRMRRRMVECEEATDSARTGGGEGRGGGGWSNVRSVEGQMRGGEASSFDGAHAVRRNREERFEMTGRVTMRTMTVICWYCLGRRGVRGENSHVERDSWLSGATYLHSLSQTPTQRSLTHSTEQSDRIFP
jgi:hypothetical protein